MTKPLKTASELIKIILDEHDMGQMEFLEAFGFDSVVPAACRSCGSIQESEPDAIRSYCDSCGKQSLVSSLVLMGFM